MSNLDLRLHKVFYDSNIGKTPTTFPEDVRSDCLICKHKKNHKIK